MRKKTDKLFDIIRWARDLADDDFIEPAAGEPLRVMVAERRRFPETCDDQQASKLAAAHAHP
jgi:hypothetical protein